MDAVQLQGHSTDAYMRVCVGGIGNDCSGVDIQRFLQPVLVLARPTDQVKGSSRIRSERNRVASVSLRFEQLALQILRQREVIVRLAVLRVRSDRFSKHLFGFRVPIELLERYAKEKPRIAVTGVLLQVGLESRGSAAEVTRFVQPARSVAIRLAPSNSYRGEQNGRGGSSESNASHHTRYDIRTILIDNGLQLIPDASLNVGGNRLTVSGFVRCSSSGV
jgi:hypothetical protein